MAFYGTKIRKRKTAATEYENLLTFTKAGAEQDKITEVTATRVTVTELIRSDEAYFYKDYGIGHFDLAAGIEHDFDMLIDETNYPGGAGSTSLANIIWALANDLGSERDLLNASKWFILLGVAGNNTVNTFQVTIYELKNQGYTLRGASPLYGLGKDIRYWFKLKIAGASITMGMYSTEALRNAGDSTDGDICNTSGTLSSATLLFRYLYAQQSRNEFTYNITMWSQNYKLH